MTIDLSYKKATAYLTKWIDELKVDSTHTNTLVIILKN